MASAAFPSTTTNRISFMDHLAAVDREVDEEYARRLEENRKRRKSVEDTIEETRKKKKEDERKTEIDAIDGHIRTIKEELSDDVETLRQLTQ